MKSYATIEHTADVGIKIKGKTERQILEKAAYGMFDLMCDLSAVGEDWEIEIEVEAEDRETLLVGWLNELLYQFEAKGIIPKRFEVLKYDEHSVKGRVVGEAFDTQKHKCWLEVKAVTFHMLKFEKVGDHWEAQIIFDV